MAELTHTEVIGLAGVGLGVLWVLMPTWMMRIQSKLTYFGSGDHSVWDQPSTARKAGRLGGIALIALGLLLVGDPVAVAESFQ